ncbi:GDSL-type esterase/lipase family protein [Enterovirga sp.]|jgi:lysophospholipase L1-like esterase|uniref:SGNH/GDSL hydrolase family protein n=1 Tax=Enterovirga sp. TaxID=2026350 RepID=UPI002633EE28|nr:GDSL-type esterase/lipase family protein [Enterovirga sp.]MDB5591245.1 lipolytic protein family [Enterovirga sp.]
MAKPLRPVPPTKESYLKRFRAMSAALPEEADLILIGDSLAASWPSALLEGARGGRRVLNLGLAGDRVETTAWRLGAGRTEHLRPRELVLLVGSNNLTDGDAPEAIAAGIGQVVRQARWLWGEPDTVVVTVPWRGPAPGFRDGERLRLNALLGRDLPATLGARVIDADRALDHSPPAYPGFLPDLVHLSPDGYRQLTRALPGARRG